MSTSPVPEMHPVLLLALTPERNPDVADPHGLGDARAPTPLEPRPKRRLTATRLARDEHAFDARAAQVEATLTRPLDDVGRV